MNPSFSTVACPEWTLDRVFERGVAWGFTGVELRSFGDESRGFACDPALTDPLKIRSLAERHGLPIVSLATSCRFDAPIKPYILGYAISDVDAPIRPAKRAIDLAASIECPLVRVFAFERSAGEPIRGCTQRIVDRLKKVADHAHRTGVRVTVENGGTYSTAAELAEILDLVGSPLLGATYSVAVGSAAGESPADALTTLGDRALSLRVKDLSDGAPVPLGQGSVPWRDAIDTAASRGMRIPVVFEWDRAWLPELAAPEVVMPDAARAIFAALPPANGPRARPATERQNSGV